jgi:hypothetical protein
MWLDAPMSPNQISSLNFSLSQKLRTIHFLMANLHFPFFVYNIDILFCHIAEFFWCFLDLSILVFRWYFSVPIDTSKIHVAFLDVRGFQ